MYRCARLSSGYGGGIQIERLERVAKEDPILEGWEKEGDVFVTPLAADTTLVRRALLPVVKKKDFEGALRFQGEALFPYALDHAVLRYLSTPQGEATEFALLSVEKERLTDHLEEMRRCGVEPEWVSSVPLAMYRFARYFFGTVDDCIVLHRSPSKLSAIVIRHQKLYFGITQVSQPSSVVQDEEKQLYRLLQSIYKEAPRESLQGVILLGHGFTSLNEELLGLSPLCAEATETFSSHTLHEYGVSIGLALEPLLAQSQETINFLGGEYVYPHPWRRIKMPLIAYAVLLCFAFLLLQGMLSRLQGRQLYALRAEYATLLGQLHQSPARFEESFLTKVRGVKVDAGAGDTAASIEHLSAGDIRDRLTFLSQELQKAPVDGFPLLPNVPRVSDLLAWLNQQPGFRMAEGETSHLQLESLNYTMVKRPEIKKPQEHYQVKVELEFSTDTPKLAREFHDRLVSPNDWVDPKGEIKWGSNRGRYKTSFFLKDKTIYGAGA